MHTSTNTSRFLKGSTFVKYRRLDHNSVLLLKKVSHVSPYPKELIRVTFSPSVGFADNTITEPYVIEFRRKGHYSKFEFCEDLERAETRMNKWGTPPDFVRRLRN